MEFEVRALHPRSSAAPQANEQAYQQYLHHAYDLAPYGLVLSLLLPSQWSDGNVFIVLYACTAYFFSNKMARLVCHRP